MVNIFKANDVSNIFLLLPYVCILRAYGLITGTVADPPTDEGLFSQLILGLIENSVALNYLVGCALVYAHALIINHWCNRNAVLQSPSALPGMFYVLIASISPSLQSVSSTLIGLTFVILTVLEIGKLYKNQSAESSIFNIGIFSAMSFFSDPPLLLTLLVGFVALIVLRSYNSREILQMILGMFAILWIYIAADFFISGKPNEDLLEFGIITNINTLMPRDFIEIILVSTYGLLLAMAVFGYYSFLKKKQIEARKKIDMLYWLLLIFLLGVFIYREVKPSYILVLACPLAIFIGMKINSWRNIAYGEIAHLALLAVLVTNLYGQSLGIIAY